MSEADMQEERGEMCGENVKGFFVDYSNWVDCDFTVKSKKR